jgi:hypothetical protein
MEFWDGWAGRKGIEWHIVPMGGYHFNVQVEWIIRIFKKPMQRS